MDSFCSSCGEYTTRRMFGTALCAPCHQREDDAIERVERRDAKRLGYQHGWSDDKLVVTPAINCFDQ